MLHKMGLYKRPFISIKSGKKTVEVRLNDEKRRKLNIGDKIEFVKLPDEDENLTVEVTDLKKYNTFKELYKGIPHKNFHSVSSTIEEKVNAMYEIYTPEKEREWGTLAIHIQRDN